MIAWLHLDDDGDEIDVGGYDNSKIDGKVRLQANLILVFASVGKQKDQLANNHTLPLNARTRH